MVEYDKIIVICFCGEVDRLFCGGDGVLFATQLGEATGFLIDDKIGSGVLGERFVEPFQCFIEILSIFQIVESGLIVRAVVFDQGIIDH